MIRARSITALTNFYKLIFYLIGTNFFSLFGNNNPDMITAIEITDKHCNTKEKLYPFFSNKDVIGNTLAPADKLTINLMESTLPLQLS